MEGSAHTRIYRFYQKVCIINNNIRETELRTLYYLRMYFNQKAVKLSRKSSFLIPHS